MRLVNQCLEHQPTAEFTAYAALAHSLTAWAYSVTCASMTTEFTAMSTAPIPHAHPPLMSFSLPLPAPIPRTALPSRFRFLHVDEVTSSCAHFRIGQLPGSDRVRGPAPFPISGVLQSVLTPGPGEGVEQSEVDAAQFYCQYNPARFTVPAPPWSIQWTSSNMTVKLTEPNCRVMIMPASNMDDEITAIHDSDVDGQAITASITTPSGDRENC
ncbi:unnamed protein product [Schistocephalus solidus]|uniref:Ig-like domain-containing protein n=1 Tax=Schistocephalus solidus TaxID=70667 RepID=A0A183T909_SCHSO|nr:unnamed protein product [Schistocephalus solidus]